MRERNIDIFGDSVPTSILGLLRQSCLSVRPSRSGISSSEEFLV